MHGQNPYVWHVLLILVWQTKQSFWFSTKLKKQHSVKLQMELELNLTPLLYKENITNECKAENLLTTEASCEHVNECCTSTYSEVLPSVSDLTFDNIWPLLCRKTAVMNVKLETSWPLKHHVNMSVGVVRVPMLKLTRFPMLQTGPFWFVGHTWWWW